MIRNNKLGKAISSNRLHSYNYRNALYQGQVNPRNGTRQGQGLIYITDTHRLIATNQFKSNKLNGPCFFYRGHAQYLYGYWYNNRPHGMAIFRLNEVLVITQYNQGEFSQGSRILYVMERYNMGLVIELDADGGWNVIQQSEILCRQHLEQLIKQCNFQSEPIPFLLIKYLNNHMVADNSSGIRLRLLSNMYYRFGCDQGLAIIFDDQYQIISVGVHNKSSLISFGAKFNGKQLGNTIEEGIFDGQHTYVFDQGNRPVYKIGQLYCRSHLAEVNFRNEIFKDPSESYFDFHFKVLESEVVRSAFRDLVLTSIDNYSFQRIMQHQPKPEEHLPSQRRGFPEFEMITFKQPTEQQLSTHRSPSKKNELSIEQVNELLKENTHRSLDTCQFQKLPEKNRLSILKKQIYTNLSHKQSKLDQDQTISRKKAGIITMSPVKLNYQKREPLEVEHAKKRDIYICKLPEIQDKPTTSPNNLEKHLNIKLNGSLDSSHQHSRRKKIFEENPNLRKDYTPEASPSPSPFKTKVRSRIFSNTPDRSKSRSLRRIFTNTMTPEKKPRPFVNDSRMNKEEKSLQQQMESFHRQFNASMDKSSSESIIRSYPVTMNNQKKIHKHVQDQYVLVKKEQQVKPESRVEISSRQVIGQRTNPSNVQLFQKESRHQMRTSTKKDSNKLISPSPRKQQTQKKESSNRQKTIKYDNKSASSRNQYAQQRKKSNVVYRNSQRRMPEQAAFEPIKVDNSPYVMSHQKLSYNPSAKTLEREKSKKSIESSLPLKRDKMRQYMNSSPYEFDQMERMTEFKRKVNYF